MCKHWLVYMAVTGGVPATAQSVDFTDTAQVSSATPIYRRAAEPGQECRSETTAPDGAQERSCGGAVLGGVAGAVLDHPVGKDSGRGVAATVGADK